MRFLPKPRLTYRPRRSFGRLLADEKGAAAIEFAMVGLAFLMFVLGVIGFGLYFFTSSSLEYGVEVASRKIRTGEINSGGTTREDSQMTVGEFRNLVCDAAGPMIQCSKLKIIVQHAAEWSGIAPQSCVDSNGNMTASTGGSNDILSNYAGSANSVVLITLCYPWELAEQFPFLKLGNGPNGTGPAVIQAATAFKSEPYS